MNLERPFLDKDAKEELNIIAHSPIDSDRSVDRAITSLRTDGYLRLMAQNNVSPSDFFAPFYRIMNREKEYRESLK